MNPIDPTSIIKSDHEKVKSMIEDYQDMDFNDKQDQADKISETLAIHMAMEEEIFYPEVEKLSDEGGELISDARSEHEEIKMHIRAMSEAMDEEDLDEHLEEMEDALLHHIEEEENSILPLAEDNLKDEFTTMAGKMMAHKAEAKGELLLEKIKSKVQ